MIHTVNSLKITKTILFMLFSFLLACLFLLDNNMEILGPVVLSVLCIGCLFSFVLDKPEMGILSALFSMAFMLVYHDEMSISYYIIYAVVPFTCLSYFIRYFPRSKIFWFLLFWIFLYYSSVITLHSYEKSITSWLMRNFLLVSVFFWSSLIKWDRKKILFITIAYGSYLIIWGLLEKIIFGTLRVSGPTGFATNYAILLVVLWTICYVDFCVRKKLGIFIVFWSISILLCVFLSGTRMGLAGMLFGAFLGLGIRFFILEKKITVSKRIIWAIGILLTVAFLIYFIWSMLPKDILIVKNINILLSGKIDISTLGRLTAWDAAWGAFQNNITWGHGPDTFIDIHAIYLDKLPSLPVKKLPVAHNEILNIMAETGLIGLLHISVIVAICLFCVINHIRKNSSDSIAVALLSAFVVLFSLMMFDASPSRGFDPWLLGTLASFEISQEKIKGR